MDFAKEGVGDHNEAVGTTRLHIDDAVVAEGPMRTQVGFFTLCGDGLCVGRDSSDAVSSAYESPGDLTGASVLQVEIDLSDDQYVDLEQEAMAALARE
jgi:arylsulfatase